MNCPTTVELRRYELKPGARETLIELFERELIGTQEAEGMAILGQFREKSDHHSFVWLRGFNSMAERRGALERFYSGPAWAAHKDAANATMVAWNNVLLLRPLPLDPWFHTQIRETHEGELSGLVLRLDKAAKAGEAAQQLATALEDAGFQVKICLGPETSANDYAPLPVRGDDDLLVVFASPPTGLNDQALGDILQDVFGRVQIGRLEEVLHLTPTSRSKLR